MILNFTWNQAYDMSSDDNPVSKAGDDVVCEAELIQDLGQS